MGPLDSLRVWNLVCSLSEKLRWLRSYAEDPPRSLRARRANPSNCRSPLCRALTPWPSMLRGVCRSGVRLAEIRKIRAHQPLIGRHPIAEGRVRGQRENHVHHVVAEAAAVEGGEAE